MSISVKFHRFNFVEQDIFDYSEDLSNQKKVIFDKYVA